MGFNKEFLRTALEQVQHKGQATRHAYDQRRRKAVEAFPRIAEIDTEIMKIGPMLGIATVSGDKNRLSQFKRKCESLAAEREELLTRAGLEPYEPCCAACADTGYIDGKQLCDCVKKQAKALSYAALSARMPIESSRFDNFKLSYYREDEVRKAMKRNFDFCRAYAVGFNPHSKSVLFFGGTGLGKTHLSLAIAGGALEKGYGVIYSPMQNLLQKLEKEHFSYSAETPLLDDVQTCDLLILDDLGAEFSTSFSLSLIYDLINSRLLTARPTIISTNLSLEDIAEKYTPRVASRIMGCYEIKRFSGNDVRQQKRLEEVKDKEKTHGAE